MPNAWFRLYSEFATDPKVQMMSEANQRRFIMVLCLRCGNDHVTLQDEEVAFQLRISEEEWAGTKAVFLARGLISEDNSPTAWDKRQFVSDSSAERVAKHRAKRREMGMTATDNINPKVRRSVLEKGGKACVYCSSTEDLTIDHKVPTRRGGTNDEDNLQVACRVCNADKRHMTHDEYMNWNGRVTLQKRHQNTDTDTEVDVSNDTSVRSVANATLPDQSAQQARKPDCPAQAIVDLYHQHMPDNPRCKVMNDARRGAIRARWREASALPCKPFGYANRDDGLKAWAEFFAICAESPFLTGKAPAQPGKPPFVADIDFLMSPSGFAKCLENKYHREAA